MLVFTTTTLLPSGRRHVSAPLENATHIEAWVCAEAIWVNEFFGRRFVDSGAHIHGWYS